MAGRGDFTCVHDPSPGISEEVIVELKLEFPQVYQEWRPMAAAAEAMRREHGEFCLLPFCHTAEAEALGGHVRMGDAKIGPRAADYVCSGPEEFLSLPEMDVSKGRIQEVLLACRSLREKGYDVILQITGPFTILNVLMDLGSIYKAMKKDPECMRKVFDKLERNLLRYITEAMRYGVQLFSYADAAGGGDILGPRMSKQYIDEFTYPFLRKAEALTAKTAVFVLCPKTVYALMENERVEFIDVRAEGPMNYGQSCQKLLGKETFAGQMCVKNIACPMDKQIIKAVKLIPN